MISLTARFRRLKSQAGLNRLDRLVIIRDSRAPVSPTAKKAEEYLADLQKRGVALVHPAPEVLATLDALRALLSDARSGDLAFQGDTIAPKTLEEWFAKHLANNLKEFVLEIIEIDRDAQGSSDDSVLIEAINTLLAKEPLVSLEEAAAQLGASCEQLEVVIRRYPQLFGLLGNSGAILFRIVQTADRENSESL